MASIKVYDKKEIKLETIKSINNIKSSLSETKKYTEIEQILPFRIKFMSVKIPGSSPSLIPPIPLQIIGFSNYIL